MGTYSRANARSRDDTLPLLTKALKKALRELYAVDFSIEAWRRGDENSLPGTLGRVRSRVTRALELLRDMPGNPQRESLAEFLEHQVSSYWERSSLDRERLHVTQAKISSISPFFVVNHVGQTIAFYRDRLGFNVAYQEPSERNDAPFFAILCRDLAMLFVKGSGAALPNPKRYEWARWDAYLYTFDPDALAAEFSARGVTFSKPLKETDDGLRGFELLDPDGEVLFFGCPQEHMNKR